MPDARDAEIHRLRGALAVLRAAVRDAVQLLRGEHDESAAAARLVTALDEIGDV